MTKFVSAQCAGQACFCGQSAERKLREVVFEDDPSKGVDELTFATTYRRPPAAFVCEVHFNRVMGIDAKD
jgi:hypothetical protein